METSRYKVVAKPHAHNGLHVFHYATGEKAEQIAGDISEGVYTIAEGLGEEEATRIAIKAAVLQQVLPLNNENLEEFREKAMQN